MLGLVLGLVLGEAIAFERTDSMSSGLFCFQAGLVLVLGLLVVLRLG